VSQGSRAYRFCAGIVRMLVGVFFREADVTGLANVPSSGGGILVAWHPNALVDGGLILARFPRPLVLGARHGLFRWPVVGWLMRGLGMVPLYRRQDVAPVADAARREANDRSLDALARAVLGGACVAVFPEGESHDEPHPTELRTGAARLFYRVRALAPEGAAPPFILPVGLHYDEKHLFGSRVLVAFHPPIELGADLARPPSPSAPDESRRDQYRRLTAVLESALHEVAHATESWEVHHALHRARKLVRAERARRAGVALDRPGMRERVLAFARVWTGYRARRQSHPEETSDLADRVKRYDRDLRALGVDDHELDGVPRLASPGLVAILALQVVLVYLVLPPILVLGYVVNSPAAAAVWGLAKAGSRKAKDEASLKLLIGAVAFPVTWVVVAVLVAWGRTALGALYPEFAGSPVLTGVAAFFLSALGAGVALFYHRISARTLHSIRVRLTWLTRPESLDRLRRERAALHDALASLAVGLDLPARVGADGRVLEGRVHDATS